MSDPQRGDIWRELHPAHTRYVRVVFVDDESVRIHRVEWDEHHRWIRPRRAPTRGAQRIRFDGRAYGYELVERST